MQGSLATKLRVMRAERGLTLRQAAPLLGVRPGTLSELERGARHPHDLTLAKIAKGYGVPVEDLLEEAPTGEVTPSPLGVAPPRSRSPERNAEAGQQQRAVLDAIWSYMRGVTTDYHLELVDPDNPDFRTATAATRWAERVRKEAKRYGDWVVENASVLMAHHADTPSPLSDKDAWGDAIKLTGPIYTLNELARRAEKRIEAMNDRPDELARKQLEKARRAAEESERQIEELRVAIGV